MRLRPVEDPASWTPTASAHAAIRQIPTYHPAARPPPAPAPSSAPSEQAPQLPERDNWRRAQSCETINIPADGEAVKVRSRRGPG